MGLCHSRPRTVVTHTVVEPIGTIRQGPLGGVLPVTDMGPVVQSIRAGPISGDPLPPHMHHSQMGGPTHVTHVTHVQHLQPTPVFVPRLAPRVIVPVGPTVVVNRGGRAPRRRVYRHPGLGF
ncbi:hypothetical protein WJX84_010608 [Apatococcus fuscideae]|uniref:Uncharacterized protein n=1 Tax=Apatococcus fuscideae TaxID=2026836 RepID=A0AAW1SKU1_9CHLO